jgi:hypothetical protein
MKKLLLILPILVIAFILIWTIKLRTPLSPSDPYETGVEDETPWWLSSANQEPTPDSDWILDYDIPDNYIPVLGGDELYMEIDDDGNIIRYRKRTLQDDGTWLWETVDPNIPENYEAVEGLDNVYKVTGIDGVVHYYRYTRNDDDTYFFTEVDENGNDIQNYALTDDEIPANYVRIDGTNIYAVYNEYGVLVGYKERIVDENGNYVWRDAEAPDTSNTSSGAIPNIGTSSSGDTNITIVSGDVGTTEKGYSEEKIYTDTKHENGWVIVYETVVTKTYDASGDLVSTKTDGPNEINRIPETEWNGDLID